MTAETHRLTTQPKRPGYWISSRNKAITPYAKEVGGCRDIFPSSSRTQYWGTIRHELLEFWPVANSGVIELSKSISFVARPEEGKFWTCEGGLIFETPGIFFRSSTSDEPWQILLETISTKDQTGEFEPTEVKPIGPSPEVLASLNGLEDYSYDNWDLEGACAITADAIRAAADVLSLISELTVPPEVAPAADGTVCMEWDTPEGLLWVDVAPDRTASVLRKINGEREEKRFGIDGPEFKEYLGVTLEALYPARTTASHEAVFTIA